MRKGSWLVAMTAQDKEEKRAYDAARYQDHREEFRVRNAAYDATHKGEKRAHGALYYRDHREEVSAYGAAYYASHKEEVRTRLAAWYQQNRDAILQKRRQEQAGFIQWLQILRTDKGCGNCGTHEGRLLHHHADPSTKKYNVSRMCSCSIDTLEEELEKCVILCYSCHNKHHAEEGAS